MIKRKQIILITLIVLGSLFGSLNCSKKKEIRPEIKNIRAFARLYGLVKYFYPGDEAAETDWDRFAIYGVKQVENAQNPAQLKKILQDMFLPVAPALIIRLNSDRAKFSIETITPPGIPKDRLKPVFWQHFGLGSGDRRSMYRSIRLNKPDKPALKNTASPPPAQPLFEKKPGFGEYISRELGRGLSCVLPIVLYDCGGYTFPPASKRVLAALRSAVNRAVPQNRSLTAHHPHIRLAGIIIAWNALRHFYPYGNAMAVDWQALLTAALEDSYRDNSELDFLTTLNRMVAGLKDGQAGVYLPGNRSRMYLPPVRWAWVEEHLVVTAVFDSSQTALRVGDMVVEVNGIKAKKALRKKEQAISAATAGWKRFRGLEELLRGPRDSEMSLQIERDGAALPKRITLHRTVFSPNYYGLVEKRKPVSREIEPGIYYLNTDITPMSEIEKLMPELQKAKSIICDFRGSPKGSHLLLSHLIKETDSVELFHIPQVAYPDYEQVTYKKMGWDLEPRQPFLSAKMIFIVDSRAMDYAETILSYIEHHKLGIIVGQPTAGTCGSANSFYLLGKYLLRWTGIKFVKPGGSLLHGKGIIPGVRAVRTLEGVKAGRDELFEKALSLAKGAAAHPPS